MYKHPQTGIRFDISELDGEFFYKARQGRVHHNTFAKVIRTMDISKDDIRVYDPKNGVFSVVGKEQAFWARVNMAKTTKKKIALLFA